MYFLPFQFNIFLFESIDQDLSNSPQPLSREAGRLEPVKRKTQNRNTETAATTNTNSEIDDHLSQRPLSRTGWMASWQIGATLRGLGRTLPTPPTLFVRHRRDKDEADADDDDDVHIIMSVCLSRNIISRRVFRSVPRCCKNIYLSVDKEKCDRG